MLYMWWFKQLCPLNILAIMLMSSALRDVIALLIFCMSLLTLFSSILQRCLLSLFSLDPFHRVTTSLLK